MATKNKIPDTLEPVITEITTISEVGKSTWYEVIYYDISNDEWKSFAGSDTFNHYGYKVLNWNYCKEIFNLKEMI